MAAQDSDYDMLSSDDGDGDSDDEKQEQKTGKIGLAEPRGVLGIHFKELRLLPWNQNVLFYESGISVYIRAVVMEKVKWTCVLDGATFPATYNMDDIKHIPVELNVNNLEDIKNRMTIELVGYESQDLHYVLARKHIHLFSIVKHMYAKDTLQMNRIDDPIAEVDVDFCFSYGVFGYGYSNQIESKELTPSDYLTRSMFCRLEPPSNRCEDPTRDVMDSKFVGHPPYIPFTCMAKDIGHPVVAFGSNASDQPETIAEPTMVIARLRERLNHNLKEYSEKSSRKERIQWLKQYIYNSQLAATSHEEIIIPEGSVFRRKHARRQTVLSDDALFKKAERKTEDQIPAGNVEDQRPDAMSYFARIRSWFGFGRVEVPSETPESLSEVHEVRDIREVPITSAKSSEIAGRRLSLMIASEDKNVRFKGTDVKFENDSIWRRTWRAVKSRALHILRWHSATQEEVEVQMSESERNMLNRLRRHSLHSEKERRGSVLTQCDDPVLGGRKSSRWSLEHVSMKRSHEAGVPSAKKIGNARSEIFHKVIAFPSMEEVSEGEEADYDDNLSDIGHPLRDTTRDQCLLNAAKVAQITDPSFTIDPATIDAIDVVHRPVQEVTTVHFDGMACSSDYSLYDERVVQSHADVVKPSKKSEVSVKSAWLSACDLAPNLVVPSAISNQKQFIPSQSVGGLLMSQAVRQRDNGPVAPPSVEPNKETRENVAMASIENKAAEVNPIVDDIKHQTAIESDSENKVGSVAIGAQGQSTAISCDAIVHTSLEPLDKGREMTAVETAAHSNVIEVQLKESQPIAINRDASDAGSSSAKTSDQPDSEDKSKDESIASQSVQNNQSKAIAMPKSERITSAKVTRGKDVQLQHIAIQDDSTNPIQIQVQPVTQNEDKSPEITVGLQEEFQNPPSSQETHVEEFVPYVENLAAKRSSDLKDDSADKKE